MKKQVYIEKTDSTNKYLWELLRENDLPEGFIVYAGFQTAGKGQTGNTWESEAKKNILFSILLKPIHIDINEHFVLSQIVGIAIQKVLSSYADDIKIKWPNDIYWKDRKITGILIENSLRGSKISKSVTGIGININQKVFLSDAPNPVSLLQITGKRYSRKIILEEVRDMIMDIYGNWETGKIRNEYMKALYHVDDFYMYSDLKQEFEAKIKEIQPDGRLDLELRSGEIRSYYFKEVKFLNK